MSLTFTFPLCQNSGQQRGRVAQDVLGFLFISLAARALVQSWLPLHHYCKETLVLKGGMAGLHLAPTSCQSLRSNLSSAPHCCSSLPGNASRFCGSKIDQCSDVSVVLYLLFFLLLSLFFQMKEVIFINEQQQPSRPDCTLKSCINPQLQTQTAPYIFDIEYC